MDGHPIEGLMNTAMANIKDMIDVNTVVGDAVETQDGTVIIPVSRVSFGFASGGGEYALRDGAGDRREREGTAQAAPFAGGSGAGVTVQPVGFLVVTADQVRLLPVTDRALYDRLIDLAPELMDRLLNRMDAGGDGRVGDGAAEDADLLQREEPAQDRGPLS